MVSDHPSENGVDGDDEREDEDEEEEEEKEAVEEEEEPRLKYQRMGGSLPSLLSTDAAASIAIAERMIALGTHDGTVHILDFQGNQVKEFSAHTATVNDLCFDSEGEYVSSCSDDGSVVINSLFTDERLKFDYHRPMKSIALDPDYSRNSNRRFVAGGLAGQLFLNSKTWLGYNKQVLHDGEGPIHAVKWRTRLIAWANDAGVKVYDMVNNSRVTFIERPRGSPRPELLLPHLVWQDDTLLVIGWGTSVKVAALRTNSSSANGTQKSIPTSSTKYVDIVASFQTSYYISGIAPFGDALVVLAYIPEEVNGEKDFSSTMPSRQGTAQRPEIRIVSWKNEELTTDALPVHGYEHYKAKDYALAHAPFTGSSYAGGQWAAGDEPFYYIVSPKDVVIARPSYLRLRSRPTRQPLLHNALVLYFSPLATPAAQQHRAGSSSYLHEEPTEGFDSPVHEGFDSPVHHRQKEAARENPSIGAAPEAPAPHRATTSSPTVEVQASSSTISPRGPIYREARHFNGGGGKI